MVHFVSQPIVVRIAHCFCRFLVKVGLSHTEYPCSRDEFLFCLNREISCPPHPPTMSACLSSVTPILTTSRGKIRPSPSATMLAFSHPQAIVSLVVDSTSGVATALGVRGLPPDSSPRDADYVLESGEESSSFVVSLDIDDGEKIVVLFQGFGLSCLSGLL